MAIDLDVQISKALNEYSNEVLDALTDAGKEVADETVKKLKGAGPSRTGAYNKGWAIKETGKMIRGISYTIHNPKRYRLTHLLEKGHVNRDGSRTAARVHIKPIEEAAKTEFEQRIVSKL